VIYPLQFGSIAIRKGATEPIAWAYAFFTLVSKFAQAQGIAKFYWSLWRGQTAKLIEYKNKVE